ncbi:MAG: hypothetical protein Kow0031_24780 [Anaerolineae bacterium]
MMATKTILCVDGDEIFRELCRFILTRCGYGVELAADGIAAVRLAVEIEPDLIVMELDLPEESGLEVLRFIRNEAAERLRETPVLVVSLYPAHHHEIQQAMVLGVAGYVSKTNSDFVNRLPGIVREVAPHHVVI